MNWNEFKSLALTKKIIDREAKKNFVVRFSRRVSLRIAYFLNYFKITGNSVSVCRIFMVFFSFYLFSYILKGELLIALCGAVLSALQLNADGVDGNLARVQKKTSFFGNALDNIASDYASIGFLTLLAYMSGELILVLLSSFTVYIVVVFRQHLEIKIPDNFIKFFRIFFYTPILFVFLPFLIIFLAFLEIPILCTFPIICI